MSGSKAIPAKEPCPHCNNTVHEIWFKGNHGEQWHLETHCNSCGWCIDPETGQTRNPGIENNTTTGFLKSKEF